MKLPFLYVAMLAWPALAQEDSPKAEVFGGYQYTRVGAVPGINANGWNAAVTGHATSWFGVTADISGAYRSFTGADLGAHTYTCGPVFSLRGERVTPFAHVLLGGFRASAGAGPVNAGLSGFAALAGGGVDVKASPRWAVRVFQLDWITWRSTGMTEKKNARFSAGVVFRIL